MTYKFKVEELADNERELVRLATMLIIKGKRFKAVFDSDDPEHVLLKIE